MKKIISVFLTLTLILSLMCIAPVSSAEDEKRVKFALATDLHIEEVKEALDVEHPESELYFHANGSGNLYDEATGITKAFLSDAAENNVDFIIIPGDLTRSGTETEHRYVAGILKEFTENTGIRIYLVPGNHDYKNNCTPEKFKEYYRDICYYDNLITDDKTASYTADLPGDFRLIAVDSNSVGNDGDGIDERLLLWIDEQVGAAHTDKKEIIFMMHHTVLEHLYLGRVFMSDFIVKNHREIAEMFCDWGIQYVFTGHEHGNDIARYEGRNGNVLYDVLTTSLSSYPLEYRIVSYGQSGVDIKMRCIDKCDLSSLVNGYNEKQLSLMKSDYTAYALGYFKYSIEKKILKYVSPDFIKEKLKADGTPLSPVIDSLLSLVCDALEMPLYGENSIEELANKKGVTLPESEHSSLIELATDLVAMHYYGNENRKSSEDPDCEIFVKGLNTALEYILCGAETKTEKALIKLSLGYFVPDGGKLEKWFNSLESGNSESYLIAEEILCPFLDKYTLDAPPSDRDVTLPALGEKVGKGSRFLSVAESIIKFVMYILNIVFMLTKK